MIADRDDDAGRVIDLIVGARCCNALPITTSALRKLWKGVVISGK